LLNLAGCAVDYIVIKNHNIGTATITFQGNNTDSWTAPAFSQVVNNTTNNDIFINFAMKQTFNFWRVLIVFSAARTYQAGLLWMSEFIQMPGFSLDVDLGYGDTHERSISYSGQVYGDQGYEFKNYKFKFPIMTLSKKNEIETFLLFVRDSIPFFLLMFDNNFLEFSPIYCVRDDKTIDFKFNIDNYMKPFECSLKIREVF
jgi:hypothetical protein